MAQINLRDYLKGLEEMIDGSRAEEALSHCRHILKTFPKNIDTYRMMGKGFLELKRHSEASDIFQRVLSSVPDDFVSHIGMSIIREDEGNQDASIWHMERAFESQPSNRAVQDELRRLYGKREGYEPPKVRLTRGALARMYSHGDLYNQAVGELCGALAEDSQRPDLQVLLAEMYLRLNRQADAIEACSKLIEKLPYCLIANRIMADILGGSQRDVEAQPYLERVEELDPYAAQVSALTPAEEAVAETVMIEQMAGESEVAPVETPKAWTASLQLPGGTGYQKEELPDWLSLDSLEDKPRAEEKTAPEAEKGVLDNLEELQPVEPQNDAAAEPPEPVKASPFTSVSKSTALQADNVPDWLRELHPATGTLSAEIEELSPAEPKPIETPKAAPAEEPATPAWLEELGQLSGSATPEEKSEPIEEKPLSPFTEPEIQAQAKEIEKSALSEEDEENLSWLEGLAAKQGVAEEELLTSPEEREQAAPDWLSREIPEAPKPKSDALAWLDELKQEDENEKKKSAVAQATNTEGEPPTFKREVQPEPETTTPNWLRDLSAEVEASSEDSESIQPRPLEEEPDWLSELRPEAESEPTEEATEPSAADDEDWKASGDLGKLDWLEELGEPKQQEPVKPVENVWVPEAQITNSEPEAEAVQPTPTPPPMTARKTARLQTAMLAPGRLDQARQALNYGKLDDAADHYGYLLRRRVMLDEVIADLTAAVRRHPQQVTLWQTLGDAYMRNNQLREALDCYTKAEDLL